MIGVAERFRERSIEALKDHIEHYKVKVLDNDEEAERTIAPKGTGVGKHWKLEVNDKGYVLVPPKDGRENLRIWSPLIRKMVKHTYCKSLVTVTTGRGKDS